VANPTQIDTGTQHPNEKLLTPRDVQARLRIGERMCYRMLNDGRLPGFRVGRLWRVREGDLPDSLTGDATSPEKTSHR
jgi:excisionase family DNA binding protein